MAPISSTTLEHLKYQHREVDKGYTNQYLDIDLSSGTISIAPIEEKVKQTFVGGKGFDLWLLWHAVSGDSKWDDPENAVCISSGRSFGV